MRIDFSEMRDYALIEALYDLDRYIASNTILGRAEHATFEAERELEMKLDELRDMFPEDCDYYPILWGMPGTRMVLDHLRKQRR